MSVNNVSDNVLRGILQRDSVNNRNSGPSESVGSGAGFAAELDNLRKAAETGTANVAAGGNNVPVSAAESISAKEALGLYQRDFLSDPVRSVADNGRIDLEPLTLDFSSMLPEGTREFIKTLKCSDTEMNSFVNLMVFGNENGPHGRNAAGFFGSRSLDSEELKSAADELLSSVRINTHGLSGEDFGFLLSRSGSPVGNSLAVAAGGDLSERRSEQELDALYKQDMALMQIMSHSNNQSADIF